MNKKIFLALLMVLSSMAVFAADEQQVEEQKTYAIELDKNTVYY